MVGGNAAVKQMLLENGEKEKAFSATAHPNENLYQVVAFCLNKTIEQQFALNYHCCAFRFIYMLTDLKGEFTYDYWMWANRRERRFREWAPFNRAGHLPTILRWYGVRIPKDEACPICGTGGIRESDSWASCKV